MKTSLFRAVTMACLISFSLSAFAGNKYFISMGGAGDPPGVDNIFKDQFVSLGLYARGNGWTSASYFNGAHPTDIQNVQEATGVPTHPFTQQNLSAVTSWMGNAPKAGDQILIVIDSHGAPHLPAELAHSVASSDGRVSLDQLQKVVRQMESNGVQVGIVDLSCYSGNSQKLASNKTCVVSATSSDDVAMSTFLDNFVQNMKPGKSLEEVFLAAKKAPNTYGHPEISTAAGVDTKKIVSSISRSQIDVSTTSVLASPFMCQQKMSLKAQRILAQQFGNIQSQTDAKDYIQAYKNYQTVYNQARDIAKKMKDLDAPTPITDAAGNHWTWEALATYSDSELKANYPTWYDFKMANPQLQQQVQVYHDSANQWRSVYQTQFNDLTKSPPPMTANGETIQQKSPLETAAFRLQDSENKLYDKIYREQASKAKGSNPCADFKL